jgi:zinc protease
MLPIVRIFKSLSVVFCLLIATNTCLAGQTGIQDYTLNNGMRVILKVDRRSPTTFTQVVYKAGAADETSGQTGIAHLLEHMLFRGTKQFPAGEYSEIISNNGGSFNAWTSSDQTVYYAHTPKTALTKVLKLEADRMRNINFSDKNFNIEKNVVLEEWRMRIADNPRAQARQSLRAAAFTANPYQHPVIGWHSDLVNLKPAYAHKFYNKFYRPNNAVLIIIGDIDITKTKALISKYFAPLNATKQITRIANPPTNDHNNIKIIKHGKIDSTEIQIAFHAKNLKIVKDENQAYAAIVLSDYLQEGMSGILRKELINKDKIATAAHTYYNPFSRYSDLLTITITCSPQVNPRIVYKKTMHILKKIKQHGIEKYKLKTIKKITAANKTYLQDSKESQANWYGLVVGNNYPLDTALDFETNINAVTAVEVKNAANRIFRNNNEVTLFLLPNKATKGAKL